MQDEAVDSSDSMNVPDIVLQSSSPKLSQKQDYIFHGGRRHVRPYYFEFIAHVNKRWTGKTIVDLFADEFKGRPRDYYVGTVKSGRIKVDGETVPASYIVKSSQKITHFLHRHEPPVMTDDVEILLKEPDVVTVCKPASIPVHPCGQYRKNTVVGILDAEHNLGPLFPQQLLVSCSWYRNKSKTPTAVELYHHLAKGVSWVPTRFADSKMMEELGIEGDVKTMLQHMKMERFYFMAYPTYEEVSCQFLATFEATFHEVEHVRQGWGKIKFKVIGKTHYMSFKDITAMMEIEDDEDPTLPKFNKLPTAIHRLDRLVSGLLIIARTAAKADFFRQQIEGGLVKKRYIAKVIGVFPEDEKVVDANINYNGSEGRSTAEDASSSGDDKKVKGKPACTKFTRIDTNGTHSLVLCEPVTGRTHQIRVHLQYTGHPIANDPLYLTQHVDDLETKIAKRIDAGERKLVSPEDYMYSSEDFSIDPMCTNCPKLIPQGYEEHDEALWLHCVRYSGTGWEYECPYPSWASLTLPFS